MSLDEFFRDLKDWLEEFKNHAYQNNRNELKTYTSEDVQGILKVSKKTLQTWRDKGYIGFSQPEGVIRYTEDDIKAFLNRFKR